ncbi:carbohydrate ABC transporter permease [Parablautia intestinalis]|uniref:carbohydrate ABC transporter permease n=1 Tax=Parablautia intestinalis TaxID=2320100 RepID=UPI00256F3495|nr:carbohydrate ABC transporter permease [Parablautia intestinalis]
MRVNTSKKVIRVLIFCILFLGAMTMVVPFLWMLSTSFKEANLVYQIPPQWIPKPVDWENYIELFTKTNILNGIGNSVIVSACVLIFGTFSTSLSAFAFAKLDVPYKNVLFLCVLSSMMVPFVVLLVPQYIIYTKVKWINTLLPMIVPGALGSVSMMFFLRQYMSGLPTELLEAAKIDGCGYFKIYYQIFLPLCKPALISNIIMVFMGTWNDYLGPMIFVNDSKKYTLQVVIKMLNSYHETQTDIPLVMAASLIAILPILILFIFCQKYFVDSMAITGLKG